MEPPIGCRTPDPEIDWRLYCDRYPPRRIDGLEAIVFKYGGDFAEEVGAVPFLVGVPVVVDPAARDALLVVNEFDLPERLLNLTDDVAQLARLEFAETTLSDG